MVDYRVVTAAAATTSLGTAHLGGYNWTKPYYDVKEGVGVLYEDTRYTLKTVNSTVTVVAIAAGLWAVSRIVG